MAPTRGPDCVVCHATARYTCPGCSARTCSLPCSTTHKTSSSCSGQRDRAAYVSREQYGYVDLMEDYRFLEDVSRRMGETTKVVKEAQRSLPRSQATRAASRGGRGAGQAGRGGPGEGLRRMAMATCEVELVLLPVGMAKREANKTRIVTSGNGKGLEWTVTWSLRLPTTGPPLAAPATITTSHKNASTSTLPELFLKMTMHGQLPKAAQAHAEKLRTPSASSDTPTKALSESAVFLLAVPARAVGPSREALEVIERIDAVPAPAPVINTTNEPLPQFRQARLGTLTPHHSLPFRPGSQPELLPTEPPPPPKPIPKPSLAKGKRYWQLSATDPLSTALRQTTIIEWPEIEVWERTAYESALRLGYIEIVQRGPVDSSSLPLPRAPAAVSQEGLTSLQAYEDSSGGEEGEVIGGGNVMGSLVGLLPVT